MTRRAKRNDVVEVIRPAIGQAACVVRLEVRMSVVVNERRILYASFASTPRAAADVDL